VSILIHFDESVMKILI